MPDQRQIGPTLKSLSHLLFRSMVKLLKVEEGPNNSVVQSHILGYFAHHGTTSIPQKQLQKHLGIRRSSMTTILQAMEKENLIERSEAGGDKRQKEVVLTDLAKQKCEEHLKIAQEVESLMIQGITEDQLQQFFLVADKIRQNLENGICLENCENK